MSTIRRILEEIHARYKDLNEGALANYIPELAKADPSWFGISLVTTDGHRYSVGDCKQVFTIQSISKAFGYGMALEEKGLEQVLAKIGVEPSGEAFNEISLEESGRPYNPMINAGAIAATALLPGKTAKKRFEYIRKGLSIYAGRELDLDQAVYRSESATGFRNRAIAYLLRNSEILEDRVEDAVEAYFMQCSVLVNCDDLALMGATLAAGGVNPITHHRAIQAENVDKVLSIMASCGMYDSSGEWIFRVGLPAKSGVGGGILGVLPGQMGLAVFSPLLDPKGNSVRGLRTFAELSSRFSLHLFNIPTLSDQSIRNVYQLSNIDSHRQRPADERQILRKRGERAVVVEMQGDLFFGSIERALRVAQFTHAKAEIFILDIARVGLIDQCSIGLLVEAAKDLAAVQKQIYVVDPKNLLKRDKSPSGTIHFFSQLQMALDRAERHLIGNTGFAGSSIKGLVPFHEFEAFAGMNGEELSRIEGLLEMQSYRAEESIVNQGSEADYFYLLAKGSVAVCIEVEGHSERIHAISPGVTFGDIALLEKGPRTATVVAETESVCYQIAAEKFHELESEAPSLYGRLLRNLLRNNLALLRKTSRQLALLRNGISDSGSDEEEG